MADISNNWMFKWEELQNSPSRKDGMTWECEKGVRHDSCIFILEIGKHLRRGKTDNAAFIRDSAACILFHRFFTAQSFKSHNRLVRKFFFLEYFFFSNVYYTYFIIRLLEQPASSSLGKLKVVFVTCRILFECTAQCEACCETKSRLLRRR